MMDAVYEKQVGENLRRLRMERGLTQEQVAARLQVRDCDVTRSALAKIEVGQRHLYVDEVKALREILNVGYEALFP